MSFITNLQDATILEMKLYYEVSGNDAILYLDEDKQECLGIGTQIIEGIDYCLLESRRGDIIRVSYEEVPILLLLRGYLYYDTRCDCFKATNPFTQKLADILLERI